MSYSISLRPLNYLAFLCVSSHNIVEFERENHKICTSMSLYVSMLIKQRDCELNLIVFI
jgi:hypothetical protein